MWGNVVGTTAHHPDPVREGLIVPVAGRSLSSQCLQEAQRTTSLKGASSSGSCTVWEHKRLVTSIQPGWTLMGIFTPRLPIPLTKVDIGHASQFSFSHCPLLFLSLIFPWLTHRCQSQRYFLIINNLSAKLHLKICLLWTQPAPEECEGMGVVRKSWWLHLEDKEEMSWLPE